VKRSSSLKRRVKEIETARGAGGVSVVFADGSKKSFYISTKNDALKVLLASFEIARSSGNPTAPSPSDTHASRIARAVAAATEVRPNQPLWQTIGNFVRGTEKGAGKCDVHARDPASS